MRSRCSCPACCAGGEGDGTLAAIAIRRRTRPRRSRAEVCRSTSPSVCDGRKMPSISSWRRVRLRLSSTRRRSEPHLGSPLSRRARSGVRFPKGQPRGHDCTLGEDNRPPCRKVPSLRHRQVVWRVSRQGSLRQMPSSHREVYLPRPRVPPDQETGDSPSVCGSAGHLVPVHVPRSLDEQLRCRARTHLSRRTRSQRPSCPLHRGTENSCASFQPDTQRALLHHGPQVSEASLPVDA